MDSLLPSSETDSFPLVTIAVITRNREESLKRTLASFSELDYPNFEVIVVDNASTDNTKSIIKQYGHQYIFSPKEFGFAKTRQLAVVAAKGKIICWCDDDCVPKENWIIAYLKLFESTEAVVLGGKIVNVGFSESLKFKGKSVLKKNACLEFIDDPNIATFHSNLNLAFRKDFITAIGGYDSFFKGGMEEIDLQLNVIKNGGRVFYCSDAEVTHYHSTVSFKKGRLVYSGTLMRLAMYFKYNKMLKNPGFVKIELFSFLREIYRNSRLIVSGLVKLNHRKSQIGLIELFNSFLSRILIPFLYIKYKNEEKS
ncbi:glycosyltransferase family 2 protein [Belliella marina]|uniref:Glycosyltransferase family 2 protein n=1 Tax=Belliella marina TaxID=1644146 RepID=A0ABW4VSV4_9BACT